jgi:hypothetical protein
MQPSNRLDSGKEYGIPLANIIFTEELPNMSIPLPKSFRTCPYLCTTPALGVSEHVAVFEPSGL